MSWLSELFGGGGGPDPATTYLQQVAAQQNAANAAASAAAEKARIAGLQTGAQTTAKGSAEDYFRSLGLDPTPYESAIDRAITNIAGTINPNDQTPGQYYTDIGKTVYGEQQDAARQRALAGLSSTFTPDYGNTRIGTTLDDPYLADINTAERSKADTFLNNLFKRGLINETGLAGGEANLNEQGSRVRSLLDTVGSDVLGEGRSNLQSIADRARNAASNLQLGQSFDPSTYGSEADTAYTEFLNKLPDKIRAAAPTGLYDTTNLASIAGAAQGPQNLGFNPSALAGILQNQTDEQKRKQDLETYGPDSRAVF